MFISNFYGFLLDEFGMLSRRAGFSTTAELSCYFLADRTNSRAYATVFRFVRLSSSVVISL